MKQKLLTVLLALVATLCLCLGLAACGGGGADVNGTYYLYELQSLNESQYYTLENGKWSDSAGENGTYNLSGGNIEFYQDFFGENTKWATGTVKDGVLTISAFGITKTYCKEGSKPSGGNQGGGQGGNQGETPSTKEYTVTFNANGGTCDIESKTYAPGKLLTGLPVPMRQDYTFLGWYDLVGRKYDATSSMPNENLYLTAHWEKTVSTYNDDYVSFKPATDGWKSVDLQFLYGSLIDEAVYVEITSDDLSGKPGALHNFTLRSVEGMEYSVKAGYTWVWYEDSSFGVVNGAQRFTLNYGSNPQFVAVSKDNIVVKTYLVDIYVLHDYYISLYDRLNAQEPYDTIRIIEGNLFPPDTEVKEREDFEYDCRVYYNSNTGKYEPFDYSEPVRKNWALYQRYKAISYTPVLDKGELEGDLEISPFAPYYSLPIPVREGYDFLGWKLGDKYFTDQWGNSGSNVLTASGKEATLTATWAVKHFYHYEKDDTVYAEHVVPSIVYNDTNKTAIWRVEYRYLTDTGEVSLTEQNTYLYGEEYTLSHIVNLGYTWYGWFDGQTSLTDNTSFTFTMGERNFAYQAKIVFDERLNDFEFSSTPTACEISGVKSTAATALEIPEYVTKMKWNLLVVCSALESLTLPFAGGSAEEDTFLGYLFGANSVYDDYVPATLKKITVTASIGEYAFYDCSGLESVTIGSGVTSIGDRAFYNCSGLTSITIPDSVTSIGGYAFENCSGLTSITIPDGVTSIGSYAFENCSGLESVTIGSGVTSIYCAFKNCSGLKNVIWNAENCTYAGKYNSSKNSDYTVFQGCTKLSGVTFGDKVRTIPDYAFYGCSGLKGELKIPNCVTSIGWSAFYNCSGLTHVIWNAENCTSAGGSAVYSSFKNCTNLKTVTFGESVKTIPAYAFYGCQKLLSIKIPDSVTSIGEWAFNGCSGLTGELKIPDSMSSIGDEAFSGCSGLTGELKIPDSVTSIGYLTFSGCSGLTGELKIPDSVTSIGGSAFSGCSGLQSVTIGSSVKTIGAFAFEDCSGLTSIVIPDSVTSIGGRAFYGTAYFNDDNNWENRTVLYIGNYLIRAMVYGNYSIRDNTKVIADEAFYNCSRLTSITIPDSVTSIGGSAFSGCSGLTSITIPDSVTSIGGSAFSGCSGLESVTIGDGVTSIGASAFAGCSGLTGVYITDLSAWCNIDFGGAANPLNSAHHLYLDNIEITTLEIPADIKEIKYSAFIGCRGLTSLSIPDSVTSIGDSAFAGCSGLTSITIPDSVTSIRYQAFYGTAYYNDDSNWENGTVLYIGDYLIKARSSISGDYTIRDNTKVIADEAFYRCKGLTSIEIPDGVTSIGDYAFYNCSGLTGELKIPDSVTSIGASAFDGCSGLESVTIGDGVTSIGESTFCWCSGLNSVTIGSGVTSIGNDAFNQCDKLKAIYYKGKAETWDNISFDGNNNWGLTHATRYYFSEGEPDEAKWQESEHWWHYDPETSLPTPWEKKEP